MVTEQTGSLCFQPGLFPEKKKRTQKHVIPPCDRSPHSSLALFVRPICSVSLTFIQTQFLD